MLTGQVPASRLCSSGRLRLGLLLTHSTSATHRRCAVPLARQRAMRSAHQALKTNLAILTTPVTVKNPVGEPQRCAKNGASGKGAGRIRGRRTAGDHCGVLREVSSDSLGGEVLGGPAFGQHGHDQLPQGPSKVVLGDGEFPVAGVDEIDGLMRYWPVWRERVQVGLSNEFVPASRVIPVCGVQRCTADAPIRCDPGDLDPHLLSSSQVPATLNCARPGHPRLMWFARSGYSRGRCRGCASGTSDSALVDERGSSASRIQRRLPMFPGRMRAGTQRPPLPGGEVCARRSGRARIRRDLGLTSYGLTPCGLPGCWPRWPFGPSRLAAEAYHAT